MSRDENTPGSIGVRPNARRLQAEEARLAHGARKLDAMERGVVERAVRDACAHRGWTLRAVNARSNHVHVVVVGVDRKAEDVMRLLKSRATVALRQGEEVDDGPVWTRHGSTRYLWDARDVSGAVRYVVTRQ
ncbi:MAG: hypothetical protein AB7G17_04970 [Phycisphaerales bacterium]